jgi:hypothetical protein
VNDDHINADDLLPSIKDCERAVWATRVYRKGSTPEKERIKRWSKIEGPYCIYCLIESQKHVRYIGITNQEPEKRLAQHIADCGRGRNVHKENWLRSCLDKGIDVDIRMLRSGLSEERAQMIEVELIRFLKKPFRLTNNHAGGATGYAGLSPESREKHRINTEKGLIASWEREQREIDMERGYCLLEDWEIVEED